MMLREGRFLDPREAGLAGEAPLAGAVNIPFAELSERTHELPPRDVEIGVVGPRELADRVVGWLVGHGRRARVVASDLDVGVGSGFCERLRLWRPNGWLEEVLPALRVGRALDVACGTGRDAVYLASMGWEVTAVDLLPDALERGRGLARGYGLDGLIRWLRVDLEREVPCVWGDGDWRVWDDGGVYDLITGFRYLHRPMFGWLTGWLSDGGSLVYETFTEVHRGRFGRPTRAAHVLGAGELRGLLGGLSLRRYSEGWHGLAHTARAWAVKG